MPGYPSVSSSTSSSTSSTSTESVPDIRRILDHVILQYMFLGKPSSDASSGNSSASPSTTRTPFAGILDALSRHLPTSESEALSIGLSGSQSTYSISNVSTRRPMHSVEATAILQYGQN